MALINLNIDSLKKKGGGIVNKLADKVVNKIENKLENAVEDLFASSLKKIGLSDSIAGQLSSRFGDAFSVGMADKYFQSSTSEQSRVSPQEICENVLPRTGAETTGEAVNRIKENNKIGVNGVSGAVHQYPDHIGSYYFSMKFADYVRPAPQVPSVLKFAEAFILPLPRELKESFDIKVSENDQGTAGGIADAATAYFTDKSKSYDVASTAETLLLSKLVQMSGDFGEAIGQFAGAVPNPHVSAIFSGIGLRSHRFEWTFAPRNAEESRNLQELIFKLKANALPSYSTNGTAALQYPQLVQIDLYPWAGEGEANKLIRFKPSLLKDVSVNYAPQGIPSFFAGTKQPTFIQLSLEFLETEIWTGNSYNRPGKDRLQEVLNLTDSIFGEGTRESFKSSVNDIFAQGDGTGAGASVATSTTGGQTPGRAKAQTAKTDTAKSPPPTPLKQSTSAAATIDSISVGSAKQIPATNRDQRGVVYTVTRPATTTDKFAYSDGSKLVKTSGKYSVDYRVRGENYRLGEFTTAAGAYTAIQKQGAF